MRFNSVAIESVGICLPNEWVTSEQIETRLEPLYSRLRLPPGRLELMTGIRQRRFWADGTLPSEKSVRSGELAIAAADFPRHEIGCLIHGSVCRDHLEPATACRVHNKLKLSKTCAVYDVSNACLGMLNGMLQIANMIELGHISAGLVLGCESARSLVETTIAELNGNQSLTRKQIKTAIASLTIGSASSAVLLVHKSRSRYGTALHTIVTRASTEHYRLCESGRDDAVGDGMQPLMDTDSEALLVAGIHAAAETYREFRNVTSSATAPTKTICHQVGSAHQNALLDSLELDPKGDFSTYPWLGNTGSSALPVTLGIASTAGHLGDGDSVGLLGIGSGVNVVMMGVDWHGVTVRSEGKIGPLE